MRKKTARISLKSLPGNHLRDFCFPIDWFISIFLLHISQQKAQRFGLLSFLFGD
jgi:hypothetical protein